MTKQQRLAALLALVLGGVAVKEAIRQSGSSQEDVDSAVIEASYTLKDMGHDVGTIPALVARATGSTVEAVTPLVARATLAEGRDPRALRSVELHLRVPAIAAEAQGALYAQAVCEPLALAPDLHAPCVAHYGLGDGLSCGDTVYLSAYATPGTAERARATMTLTTFDADPVDPCDTAPEPEPEDNANLSAPQ